MKIVLWLLFALFAALPASAHHRHDEFRTHTAWARVTHVRVYADTFVGPEQRCYIERRRWSRREVLYCEPVRPRHAPTRRYYVSFTYDGAHYSATMRDRPGRFIRIIVDEHNRVVDVFSR